MTFHGGPTALNNLLSSAGRKSVTLRQIIAPSASGTTQTPEDSVIKDFDWGLCLALAGCAFEAYNDLAQEDKHLVKRTCNGTEISFVDVNFLQSRYDGILEIHLKRANDLQPVNWIPGTNSDPFCLLTVDGAEWMSSTKWGSLNPEWNERAVFFVSEKEKLRLNCRLLDDAVVGPDSLMGTTMLTLKGLKEGKEEEFTNELGPGKGTITFALKYTPLSGNANIQDAVVGSMGGPVVGSLPEAILHSPWRALRKALISAEEVANLEFRPIAFIENPQNDSQAWILWNPRVKRVVVSFRGTEQTQWKDLLTDAEILPTRIDHDEGTMRISKDSKVQDDTIWVHTGFLKAYICIQKEVADIVRQVVHQNATKEAKWTCYVTGHSLGGALSTLCAFDLAMQGTFGDIICYNFGSPMVGSQAFTESFNDIVPTCWRIVNENDAVCQVPRLIGYSHCGRKVLLCKDGTVEFAGVEAMDAGEGTGAGDVIRKLSMSTIMSLASQVKALESIRSIMDEDLEDINVNEIIQSEIDAMKNLLDGSGIDEHLEGNYLGTIEAAIRTTLENIKDNEF